MEAAMEVEMEGGGSSLRVRNTVQTNFGDEYVFQISSSQEIAALAASLSTNAIKFYSPETGQYFGECTGHSGTINEISFSDSSSAHVLHSCSSDGTVRAWDTRTFKQVSLFRGGSPQEIFSFSFGGSSGYLLAAGCNAQILFWDWRSGKQVACLEDSHTEDVTQVHFVPSCQRKLVSASVDGLVCTFDTEGHIDDDNQMELVMNVGTSIAKVGFFGERKKNMWCLTNIETLSIWDWEDARKEVDFQDARSLASNSWNREKVDYFVDCYSSGADDRIWLIGGTNNGTLGYFPVNCKGPGSIASPDALLEGGHAGVVRTFLPASAVRVSQALSGSIFGWTGGEDGRLCCWRSEDSPETNHSWISSTLTMKSAKKKNRHHPY